MFTVFLSNTVEFESLVVCFVLWFFRKVLHVLQILWFFHIWTLSNNDYMWGTLNKAENMMLQKETRCKHFELDEKDIFLFLSSGKQKVGSEGQY